MTGSIKNTIKELKGGLEKVISRIVPWTPLNSRRFSFLLIVSKLWTAYEFRNKIGNLLMHKKALNNSQKSILFIFNCFLNKTYDRIYPHVMAENPMKYLKDVCIEGEEYVRQLIDNDRGVILISAHFGPMFLLTLLFKNT